MIFTADSKRILILGSILAALAVMIGAFGAHGLKNIVAENLLQTFETGVRYHFYHAFALLFLGILKLNLPQLKTNLISLAFAVGILLFSFNCYFYVISGIKIFAILVPIGGVLFIVGWLALAFGLLRLK